jgi:hypothetical protein
MMSCFNQFSGSLQQLSNSMAYLGNYMGTMGGTQSYVRYSIINGQPITDDNKICGQGTLRVLANLCKGGVPNQQITMTGEECGQPSGSCQGQCNYNVQMIQSGVPAMQGYGAYTNTFGSSIGSSAPITCDLNVARCKDGTTITVTAAGLGEPKSESFTYTKVCPGGLVEKAVLGGECDNNKPCSGSLVCCYQNHSEVNVKKRCVNLLTSCACVKTDGVNGYCKAEEYQKAYTNKCENTPNNYCPDATYKYCCT